jgi:hypothetical protein
LPEERSDIRRDNDPPPPPSSPSKTRTVLLRISSKLIDELQTEADNRHISFTALANQILERYAEWARYEIKMNMMPVPKMILSALIDKPLSIAESSRALSRQSSQENRLSQYSTSLDRTGHYLQRNYLSSFLRG